CAGLYKHTARLPGRTRLREPSGAHITRGICGILRGPDYVFTEVILRMTEQTTHHLAESISALVDSQASELELQRILKTSQSDPQVKMIWARYQVASAVMRHDMPAFELTDFSARVSAALETEETYVAAVN